jgi:hypothetical protein
MKAIISILIIALLYSCGTGEPMDIVHEYVVKNISAHNVKLIVYERLPKEDNSFIDSNIVYVISQNKEIKMSYIDVLVDDPFDLFNDSAYVIFDDTKQIIYRQNDEQVRNILDVNNFKGGKIDEYFYQYVYEISDEDYENAIEIKK